MEDANNIKRLSDIDEISNNSGVNCNLNGSRNTIDEILSPIKKNFKIEDNTNDLKLVQCRSHGSRDIIIDSSSYKLKCNKCSQNGQSGYDLELNDNTNNINFESNISFCDNHQEEEANFFCSTCKIFICATCISSDHREHESNLIKSIAEEFKHQLKQVPSKTNFLIEENNDKMKNYSTTLKEIKDTFKQKLINIKDSVISANNKQVSQLQRDFLKSFNKLDEEGANLERRLINKINTINSMLGEIEDKGKVLGKISDPYKFCEYKQKNIKDVLEATRKLQDECKYLLRTKVKEITTVVEGKKEDICNTVEKITKRVKVYEQTAVSCIQSGTTSNSFLIRRFKRFMHDGIKYFKTTSLNVKILQPAFLVGVCLCGLYSKKNNQGLYGIVTKQEDQRLKLHIQIVEEDHNIKLNECHYLSQVTSRIDPTYLIHFNLGTALTPGLNYMITITNMDESHYVDMWNGGVSDKLLSTMSQEVMCNNLNNTFYFSEATNIQTDFNEFNCGIIEGVIYSKI